MRLFQAPFAAAEVDEEAGVAEGLELLADFVADVAVAGMELLEFAFEGIDFRGGESGLECADMSALWGRETCLAGGKRCHATAVHT